MKRKPGRGYTGRINRKKTKKRNLSRRRRSRKPLVGFKRSPFPMRYKASMKYSMDAYTLTTDVASQVTTYRVRANSLFDPEFALGGEQPMGFDQMMAFYNKYTVIGHKAYMEFYNLANTHIQVAAYYSNDASPVTNWEQMIENGAKQIVLPPFSGNGTSKKLRVRINPNKFLSIAKPLQDASVSATESADPANVLFLNIAYKNPDSTYGPGQFKMNMVNEYKAVFHDPKIVPRS